MNKFKFIMKDTTAYQQDSLPPFFSHSNKSAINRLTRSARKAYEPLHTHTAITKQVDFIKFYIFSLRCSWLSRLLGEQPISPDLNEASLSAWSKNFSNSAHAEQLFVKMYAEKPKTALWYANHRANVFGKCESIPGIKLTDK